MTYLGFERRVLSGSSENSNKNLLLYEVYVVVSPCETCCTSADPVSVSEHFCGVGTHVMDESEPARVSCVSCVSRLPCLLTPGCSTSRCRRGGADSKQLMERKKYSKNY